MNYISQLNAFWLKVETDQNLKHTTKLVYLALLQLNNKLRWISVFPVSYGQVISMTGINPKTYYSALKELESLGYLSWHKGPNQYLPAKFTLKTLYNQDNTTDYDDEAF